MSKKIVFGARKEKLNKMVKDADGDLKKMTKAKKAKKPEKEVDEPEARSESGLIQISEHGGIKIVEEDADTVQIQKFYRTKADPTWKRGKGGFNLPNDAKVIKRICKELKKFVG